MKETQRQKERAKKCYIYIMERAKNRKSSRFMVNDDIAISISPKQQQQRRHDKSSQNWIKY